jgi:hypothetical protein
LLEKFCKREEATHYKDFCSLPAVQNLPVSKADEIIFDRLIIYSQDKSLPFKSKESFSRLPAAISPSLRRIAVIVNQAVMVWWQ